MPYANSNGVQIYYELEGQGEPLLLGHGLMGSTEFWRGYNYPEGLVDTFQVILFDARGHGKSDKPTHSEAYELQLVLKDALAVLDALSIEKTHYWGYSMGGRTGFGLASYYPERLTKLVIGGASPYDAKKEDQAFIIHFLELVNKGLNQGVDALLKGVKAFLGRLTPQFESRLRSLNLSAMKANLEAAMQAKDGLDAFLGNMTMPSLLYCGTKDEPVHSYAKRAAKVMPKAKFHSLENMNHSDASDATDAVLGFVKPFLQAN